MADYSKMTPPEVWKLIRTGEITRPTAGMCAGYAQANLVILPKKYADDFKEFARKNPKPCPILEVVEGTPDIHDMGEGASIVTDIPKYFIYRDGVKVDEVTDVSSYWKEDSVAFLIGCSFSFEEALMKAGIEVRHIAQGCTGPSIPLYKNLPKAPITASKAAFAVRFLIHDKPGVLAAIAAEFAKNGVSINGVNQDLKPTMTDPGYDGEIQQLRIVTHLTDEETLRNTVKAVQALDFVTGDPSILRVLD